MHAQGVAGDDQVTAGQQGGEAADGLGPGGGDGRPFGLAEPGHPICLGLPAQSQDRRLLAPALMDQPAQLEKVTLFPAFIDKDVAPAQVEADNDIRLGADAAGYELIGPLRLSPIQGQDVIIIGPKAKLRRLKDELLVGLPVSPELQFVGETQPEAVFSRLVESDQSAGGAPAKTLFDRCGGQGSAGGGSGLLVQADDPVEALHRQPGQCL